MKTLKERLVNRKARIGIIGLGYVGLPLAVEFAKAGFKVTGIDLNKDRIDKLNKGSSYILDVPEVQLKEVVNNGHLYATDDHAVINRLDAIIICVPTPLRKTRDPDISFVLSAAEKIKTNMKKGQLIVLESTTYPGTTEETLLTLFESSGRFKVGRDFCLAFSPERIDPGNKDFNTRNIPKIVGGVTKHCTQMTMALYSNIVSRVIPVSSPKTAEMVKLLENTFRAINIGLVNELCIICDRLGIDVWEVIEAAKTKPFGFMPFYPGPGIGGECIPCDPIYLSWKARLCGFEARFIELADQLNRFMPHYVVDKTTNALNDRGMPIKDSRILVLGVAYKRDVSDVRETPAVEVISQLKERKAKVIYHDPYVPFLDVHGTTYKSVNLTLKDKDCIILVTDHSSFDYGHIADCAKLIIDTRNVFGRLLIKRKNIIKL